MQTFGQFLGIMTRFEVAKAGRAMLDQPFSDDEQTTVYTNVLNFMKQVCSDNGVAFSMTNYFGALRNLREDAELSAEASAIVTTLEAYVESILTLQPIAG